LATSFLAWSSRIGALLKKIAGAAAIRAPTPLFSSVSIQPSPITNLEYRFAINVIAVVSDRDIAEQYSLIGDWRVQNAD
jgi:hypothetical protein